jgi:hypothetical protein
MWPSTNWCCTIHWKTIPNRAQIKWESVRSKSGKQWDQSIEMNHEVLGPLSSSWTYTGITQISSWDDNCHENPEISIHFSSWKRSPLFLPLLLLKTKWKQTPLHSSNNHENTQLDPYMYKCPFFYPYSNRQKCAAEEKVMTPNSICIKTCDLPDVFLSAV